MCGIKATRLVVLLASCRAWAGVLCVQTTVYGAKALFRVKSEERVLSQEDFFKDTQFLTILSAVNKPYMVERIAATFGIKDDHKVVLRRHFKKLRAVRLPFKGEPGYTEIEVSVYAYSKELATQWLDRAFEVYYAERAARRRDERLQKIRECREEMSRMQAEMRAYAAKQDAFRERTSWDDIRAQWDEYESVPRRIREVQRRLTELQALRASLEKPNLTTVERLSLLASKGWRQTGPRIGQVFERVPSFEARRPVPLASELAEGVPAPAAPPAGPAAAASIEDRKAAPQTGRDAFVVIPGMGSAPTDGWEILYQEKLFLEGERAELGKVYLAGHPKMRAVMQRLEAVESELRSKYDAALARLDWEVFVLGEEKRDLQRKLPQVEEVRQRYDAVMEQFVQLKYGELPWNEKYNQLLERMSIAQMELDYGSSAPEEVHVENLGYTQIPELPVSPHRGKLLVFCVFLGVVLSTAAVFLLEHFDRTIGLVESAEDELGLRGLGIVPLVPHRALPANCRLLTDRLISEESDQRSLIETFRIIRANLMSSGSATDHKQVIMVTSSLPREGKSAVSTNLAMALARAGKKTLLIDADARRGRLQRELGQAGRGLADVLHSESHHRSLQSYRTGEPGSCRHGAFHQRSA